MLQNLTIAITFEDNFSRSNQAHVLYLKSFQGFLIFHSIVALKLYQFLFLEKNLYQENRFLKLKVRFSLFLKILRRPTKAEKAKRDFTQTARDWKNRYLYGPRTERQTAVQSRSRERAGALPGCELHTGPDVWNDTDLWRKRLAAYATQ